MPSVNPAEMTQEQMITELLLWLKQLNPDRGDLWASIFLADLVKEMNRQAPSEQCFNRQPDGNYGFMPIPTE